MATSRHPPYEWSSVLSSGTWTLSLCCCNIKVSEDINRSFLFDNWSMQNVNLCYRIRRKTLYYMYNIVFPCMMMSTLTVLVFCMPPDSGEKIALGVTVILAFSVFMLAIAERMPETSESIPLIGIWIFVNLLSILNLKLCSLS